MSQAADYFVSYASADRAWAEWIAWQLDAEGYTVVVQAWDFAPGRDWAHEMQYATTTAERVVAVLSPFYLASVHGGAEWRAFYAKDPSGERGLLLPVRVSDVEPPGLLKTRIYVDLVGKDAKSARATLLAAARGVRGKPTSEPEFPGMHGQSRSHGTEAPQFPGEPASQTPTKSRDDPRGDLTMQPSGRPPQSVLPPELLQDISSEAIWRRVGAVEELGRLLHTEPGKVAAEARAVLQQLIYDDRHSVSQAAIRALSTKPRTHWTRGTVELLHAKLPYPGARALLDEAARRAPRSVLLREVSQQTGSRTEQISAELGAMTKLCKQLFGRVEWPVDFNSSPDGATYRMDPEIAQWWRQAGDSSAQPPPVAASMPDPESGPPDLSPAFEVVARVAADHRQRAVPLEFASVDEAHAYRDRLRSALTERAAAGDVAIGHVRPWVWTPASSGRALTETGSRTAVEVRLSYYR
jgi:hypothetical protein